MFVKFHDRIEGASKYQELYETIQWENIIRGAKRKQPFYVRSMVTGDFYNFKNLCNIFINVNKTTEREVVKYMSIRRYFGRKGDSCIYLQYSMNAPIVRINLFQRV